MDGMEERYSPGLAVDFEYGTSFTLLYFTSLPKLFHRGVSSTLAVEFIVSVYRLSFRTPHCLSLLSFARLPVVDPHSRRLSPFIPSLFRLSLFAEC